MRVPSAAPLRCAFVAVLCALLCAPAATRAAAAPLTLADALARALRDNPDLRAARARVHSAHADARDAGLLGDPTFTYTPGSPAQTSVTEPLDVGPQHWLRSAQAAHALHAARLDVADTERQVRFAVRQAWFDVLLADTLAALARDEATLLARVAVADSARLASGDAPERDVTRSAIEAATADAAAQRARAAAHAARLALAQLIGDSAPDTALAVAGALEWRDVPVADDSLAALAIERRPDLAAAHERVVAAQAGARAALADLVPVPQATWVHQQDEPFPNGRHDALGFGFSLPLFSVAGGGRERAHAGADAARIDAQRTTVAARSGLATALDAFATARTLASRYAGGLLAHAADALAAARFAYERGALSQLELFDAIRADHAVRSDAYTALHDYWVAAYALNRETGKEIVP